MKNKPFFRGEDGLFTYCKGCKWLKPDNSCQLQRLEIWKKQGKRFKLSAENYPEIGTICAAHTDMDSDTTVEDVYNRLELKADMVVILNSDVIKEEINCTLDCILHMDLKPNKVFFVNLTDKSELHYVGLLQEHKEFNDNILWSVVRCNSNRKDIGIDEAVAQSKTQYYCVFYAGTEIPWDYLRKFDNDINKKLEERFFVYTNEFPEFTFVFKGLHNKINGWKLQGEYDIKDKMKILQKSTEVV